MAEARQLSLTSSHLPKVITNDRFKHVVDITQHSVQMTFLQEGTVLFVPHPLTLTRSAVRSLYRFRNKLVNLLWPLGPYSTAAVVLAFAAMVVQLPGDAWFRAGPVAQLLWDWDSSFPWAEALPTSFRIFYLAVAIAIAYILGLMVVQRLFLRVLLSYKGWMWEGRRPSFFTLVWGASLRAVYVFGRHPSLYSFQNALPALPAPSLRASCTRLLDSVKPVMSPAEYAEFEGEVATFLASEGPTLQRYLYLRSWLVRNYVSDWWEQYVYLRGRDSILINSNYYGLGLSGFVPTNVQSARAAVLVWQFLQLKRTIEREELEPMLINGTVPLCMQQYARMFSTTRVPGGAEDTIMHYDRSDAKHVAVLYRGQWFRLSCTDNFGNLCTPHEIEQLITTISTMAPKHGATEGEAGIPALTCQNRTTWAEHRETFFADGINRQSLNVIERAAFVLCLDEEAPTTWSEEGRSGLHGTGRNRWVDKSLTLVVHSNGKALVHAEHAWGDAPAVAHMWELATGRELSQNLYGTDGHVIETPPPTVRFAKLRCARKITPPMRLVWDLGENALKSIATAEKEVKAAISDLHLNISCHDAYGKGFIKSCKVSPDAYIQMALQLAFYRDQRRFGLTYESSMTRLFRGGRTETIRSCSLASTEFVLAMDNPKSTHNDRQGLLEAAARTHSESSKRAMIGQGFDRHLFALYVVSRGIGREAKVLSKALSMPWDLSTSQLPQRQTPPGTWPAYTDNDLKYLSPSGGFGPVSDTGYGVSYMVAGEGAIFFHVTSKHSCDKTDSDTFAKAIHTALKDMKSLFE